MSTIAFCFYVARRSSTGLPRAKEGHFYARDYLLRVKGTLFHRDGTHQILSGD